MFDSRKKFKVVIASGGRKECLLAFPTDQQWADRMRRGRIVRKVLGGGRLGETEFPDQARLSAELFAVVRQDTDGAAFDDYEANAAIGRLERCEVMDVRREGEEFDIEMQAPGAVVTHRLRMPTLRERDRYDRARPPRVESGREIVMRASLEPSADLWQSCFVATSGYVEGSEVPIIHKARAVYALLEAVDAAFDEPDPEA